MIDVTLEFPLWCVRGVGDDDGATAGPGGYETKAGTTGLAEIPMTRELVRSVAWNRMKGSCEHPCRRTMGDCARSRDPIQLAEN